MKLRNYVSGHTIERQACRKMSPDPLFRALCGSKLSQDPRKVLARGPEIESQKRNVSTISSPDESLKKRSTPLNFGRWRRSTRSQRFPSPFPSVVLEFCRKKTNTCASQRNVIKVAKRELDRGHCRRMNWPSAAEFSSALVLSENRYYVRRANCFGKVMM